MISRTGMNGRSSLFPLKRTTSIVWCFLRSRATIFNRLPFDRASSNPSKAGIPNAYSPEAGVSG